MAIFVNLINTLGRFFYTLSKLVTLGMVMLLLLAISVFTPVFSQGVLAVLDALPLPNQAYVTGAPSAIVVLGGGLTNDKQNNIILNSYSLSRLQTAQRLYQTQALPIIVSGKEAPWMMRYLQRQGIFWVVPEKNSFNTCQNAKFTAASIQVSQAVLVTDPYHMNRARRQFARYGIATVPQIAPLSEATSWQAPGHNLKHSRRALYELLALMRDLLQPQVDCAPTRKKN